MDLKIALPTDIKDDERSIQFAHVMWGLAIHFPRRKQVQDVAMRFTSCFGTCNLDVEHTSSPTNGQQTSSDDDDVDDDDVDTPTPQENKATVDDDRKAVQDKGNREAPCSITSKCNQEAQNSITKSCNHTKGNQEAQNPST